MPGELSRDVRHALRGLVQRPGFTAACLAILGLGIGAATAVFSIFNALLLRPLPFGERSPRLVVLHSTHATQHRNSWDDAPLSHADLRELGASSPSLESVAGYVGRNFTLAASGEAERVRGGSVTPELFPLLGVAPQLGRPLRAEDAQPPGFEPVALLSHGLWQRAFGGDRDIVGREVHINGRAVSVVGVMPAGFRFPERDELWVPWRPPDDERRDRRYLFAVGLLREGASLAAAGSEAGAVAARLAERHPDTHRGWGLKLLPFRDSAVGAPARALSASLLGAVGFVLLIGCANLANLMLARGAARRRELAVRTALGATRARLVRAMLVEALLLAGAGGAIGLYLSGVGIDLMVAAWPEELPFWVRLTPDSRVAAFVLGVCLATALLFGLLPALGAARADVVAGLRDGGRGPSGPRARRLERALVVSQVALCLALLVGANLMIRSFLALQSAPSGFDESRMLSLRLYLAGDAYDPVEAKAAFFRRAVEALRALPGVASAVVTTSIPTDDGGAPVRVVAEGAPALPGEETGVQSVGATPGLFETLGVGLLSGRPFTDAESANPRAEVAIVNRRLAAQLWPAADAVGRRLGLVEEGRTTWLSVVGVAPDVHYEEIGEDTSQSRLNLFLPYARFGWRSMAALVRTHGDPSQAVAGVRAALRRLDPGVPLYDVRTMDQVRAFTTWEQRFFGRLMGAFALAALLLACVGVYGLLAYAVGRRTQEIGVRMALGARPGDMARLVLSEGARLAAAGAALGLALALALARALRAILYGVSATEPLAFAGMALLLLAVVLLASLLPARRAARIEPMAALRHE
jgi:putative ABC transport system permease protein